MRDLRKKTKITKLRPKDADLTSEINKARAIDLYSLGDEHFKKEVTDIDTLAGIDADMADLLSEVESE